MFEASCFCGCGRAIPLRHLTRRSHNNRGQEVVAQLAWLRGPAVAGTYEDEREWAEEGDDIVDVLTKATHGELRRPNLSAIAAWQKELRHAQWASEARQRSLK
jgi:hypothetical protein